MWWWLCEELPPSSGVTISDDKSLLTGHPQVLHWLYISQLLLLFHLL